MTKSFELAHAEFLRHHLESRSGERRDRLERGHGHGEKTFLEKIWWPLMGNFDNLHPEYEVLDWRGYSYFTDFAELLNPWRYIYEVKGFGSHVKDMDRTKFCNELCREAFLQAMGFQVVSFAYDDVVNRPQLCITLLKMIHSRHQPTSTPVTRSELVEKELLRLAISLARPIRPKDVQNHMKVNHRTAIHYLNKLNELGWISPITTGTTNCGESANTTKSDKCKSNAKSRILRYSLDPLAWKHLQ